MPKPSTCWAKVVEGRDIRVTTQWRTPMDANTTRVRYVPYGRDDLEEQVDTEAE